MQGMTQLYRKLEPETHEPPLEGAFAHKGEIYSPITPDEIAMQMGGFEPLLDAVIARAEKAEAERDEWRESAAGYGSDAERYKHERGEAQAACAAWKDVTDWGWGFIANAGGGDWTKESKEWQEGVVKWRDKFFAMCKSDDYGKAITEELEQHRQNEDKICELIEETKITEPEGSVAGRVASLCSWAKLRKQELERLRELWETAKAKGIGSAIELERAPSMFKEPPSHEWLEKHKDDTGEVVGNPCPCTFPHMAHDYCDGKRHLSDPLTPKP
jgi:hypothetical protein